MRQLLEALIRHAGTASRVKSIPMGPTEWAMNVASALGLSPLGPYHSLMYGRSLWFDLSKAEAELDYAPRYSNESMICETYDWYRANKAKRSEGQTSHHKSPVKQKLMMAVPHFLRLLPA
jgi:nucleoside-diphosphate-sugar epimerase